MKNKILIAVLAFTMIGAVHVSFAGESEHTGRDKHSETNAVGKLKGHAADKKEKKEKKEHKGKKERKEKKEKQEHDEKPSAPESTEAAE
ncbi:hypothetical protein GX586_15070 [bacterium]|nr:hypothetical protein [bacterium]